MSVVVRAASAEDVEAVTALEQEVFGVDAWSSSSVREELTGDRRHAVVAQDGGLVGYAVTMRSDDVVDLQRMAVAPSHRRTGVARDLLATLRRAGRDEGAHRMLLEVSAGNDAALAFYAAEGFVEIDRRPRYYRDGSDALVLRAALGGAACGGRAS
jgi:ribosomal-protein-alanine N-acetyltransferase